MKKKLYIIPALLATLALASCGGDDKPKATPFNNLAKCIYSSEEALTGFDELYQIYDGDNLVHSYERNFTLERGNQIKTSVTETTNKLSVNGNGLEETIVSYNTIDEVKYNSNGSTEDYTIPTYFLTFMVSEEYFEEGYSLVVNGSDYTLSGTVKSNYVSSVFINKSLEGVEGLTIEIIVDDSKLQSFKATFDFESGFEGVTNIEYSY